MAITEKHKIVAVIPAYNEELTISDVVKESLNYVDRVIVIDDCSLDQTGWVAERSGAEAFKNIKQSGVGASTRKGFLLSQSADIVVTLDGDGQHKPKEIPKLCWPIRDDICDITIGSRFYQLKSQKWDKFVKSGYIQLDSCPTYRKFGIDVITWLYNTGHKKITDAQSCFRAYNRKSLDLLEIEEDGFSYSTEILIKARKLGLRIMEVAVSRVYHKEYSRNSTLNPLRHGLGVALDTVKWRYRLLS